jgi:hypothetical protein
VRSSALPKTGRSELSFTHTATILNKDIYSFMLTVVLEFRALFLYLNESNRLLAIKDMMDQDLNFRPC